VRFEQLAPGRYFIEEVTAPSGYLRSAEVRQVDLTGSANIEIEWKNTPLRDLIIVKVDNDNGQRLSGAVFRLLDSRGNELARATTDASGNGCVLQAKRAASKDRLAAGIRGILSSLTFLPQD
jgi:uncharacterized surface anchored protein